MGDIVHPFGHALGIGLEPIAHGVVRAGRAEPDGDQVIAAQEQRGLAIGDLLALLELGRARDDEQALAIDLDLGHLRRVERVLDRQRVKIELAARLLHLGRGRLAQPDPVEAVRRQRHAGLPIQRERVVFGASGGITARGDDRHGAGCGKVDALWQSPRGADLSPQRACPQARADLTSRHVRPERHPRPHLHRRADRDR